jgi:hypothetical protein
MVFRPSGGRLVRRQSGGGTTGAFHIKRKHAPIIVVPPVRFWSTNLRSWGICEVVLSYRPRTLGYLDSVGM